MRRRAGRRYPYQGTLDPLKQENPGWVGRRRDAEQRKAEQTAPRQGCRVDPLKRGKLRVSHPHSSGGGVQKIPPRCGAHAAHPEMAGGDLTAGVEGGRASGQRNDGA